MLNFAIYVLEFISVLLIIHLVFQSRFRMDFAAVVLFLVSMLTLFLAYFTEIQLMSYIVQFAFYIYSLIEFRKTWWDTLVRVACAIAIGAILETMFRGQFLAWYQTTDYPLLVYVGINSCMLACVGLFYWFFIHKRMCLKIDFTDKTFITFVAIINLFVLYVKDDMNGRILQLAICVISFILLVGRFAMILKKENKGKTQEEQKWLSQYTEQYETLICEVRRRQHDYKNEIQTIKMVCATGDGTFPLEILKEYENSEQYAGILNGCENPVIAGLVYSKVKEFEEQGVKMISQIRMRNVEFALEIREVIDVIGILLDNAFECTREQENRTMQLEIEQVEKGVSIKTSNPSPYIPYAEISKMFVQGYSTKGKNRGIGLHTVRELVKKCHGDIITGNRDVDGNNYFDMQVFLPLHNKRNEKN